MWSETFLVLIAGALVYSTNDQIQRQSTASSVNQEQEFSACHNIEGMSEARNLSDTLAAKANCHVLDSQLASISSPRKETVPLSLPSEELPLQKQSSRASENQSISPKEEYIQNLEQSLQSVVNQGGLLKKINLLVQCLNRKAISNGKHFSKYKQKNIDAVQILEEGMLFVSSLLQQLGDEFQPLLSIREDSTKWRPPHMTATCTMDDSFPSVPHDSNNDIDTTVSKGMSTLAEQKCCTHFDRHRMNEPQNENRRKQITVSSKELGLWLYAIERQYNSSCHRFLQGTLVSLYCQCSASSTTGYFTKVLTKSSCLTYHSVSLLTFDPCIHDLYIHGGVDYNTVVDDQGQDNESDSDSEPNKNSEDEDEHGDQHNSDDSGATGGSGSSAGSGDGNDDNNGGNHSNNGGNNIHEDDEDGDEDEDDEENDVNDDNYSQLPVVTETELKNIPKLDPIQPCEGIIVAPICEIHGTQSCMVTGAIASPQNTDPTTECCCSVPLMRGRPIVPGIILNNPLVTCEHISCENHSHQSEVLTSRERQGTEQFHVVGPVDEMDGFLQQNDSVPIHEPIQVCDEQFSVGACETFICDGPFQETEI